MSCEDDILALPPEGRSHVLSQGEKININRSFPDVVKSRIQSARDKIKKGHFESKINDSSKKSKLVNSLLKTWRISS